MLITQEYKRVNAIFDSVYNKDIHVQKGETQEIRQKFKVGLVTYVFVVTGSFEQHGYYSIKFGVADIDTTPKDEFIKLMSSVVYRPKQIKETVPVKTKKLPEKPKLLSYQKALQVRYQIGVHGIYNLGNAFHVGSQVMGLIVSFIREYKPECIQINAQEISRRDLYRRSFNSFLKRSLGEGVTLDVREKQSKDKDGRISWNFILVFDYSGNKK